MADHFVIDGSNLATEGRTEPSLAQLQEAVKAFKAEQPDALVTVVVDASFEHRIDPKESKAFAKVEAAGEVASPPAGAVGRGDGFLLQIADRTGGAVVSNDSFQEFHADYKWLFDTGRLIGGKPVPAVGWIFSLRKPVRGPVSRKAVEQAEKKATKETKAQKAVKKAIDEAKAEAMRDGATTKPKRRSGRRAGAASTPEAVNDPAPFLQFVIDHRLGTKVSGAVDAFASHGAFVIVDGLRCYVPISALGDPPPSRARDVLQRGDTREFVVQAVDAPRRGIELGLPGFSNITGTPTDEMVAAEVARSKPKRPTKGAAKKAATRRRAASDAAAPVDDSGGPAKTAATTSKRATTKAATTKARAATSKVAAKKSAAAKTTAKTAKTATKTPAGSGATKRGAAATKAAKASATQGTAKKTTARAAKSAKVSKAGATAKLTAKSTSQATAPVVKQPAKTTRRSRTQQRRRVPVHQERPVPSVSADEIGDLADTVLLDVREPDEWEAGHAPDAWFWPLAKLDMVRAELPLDRPIVCICRSGVRSAKATQILREWGLDAKNFEGGMRAWQAADHPVVHDDGTPGDVI